MRSLSLFKRAVSIAVVTFMAFAGLAMTTASPAAAHQGNITVDKIVCVDVDTVDVTYKVEWSSVPPNAQNTVIGSRTGTQTFNDGWDDSPAAATAWANVNRGAVGSAAGNRTWIVRLDKSQFGGTNSANGPWEYAHFPWTNGNTGSRYHDTRVENFDWNTCTPPSVSDASASVSTTPATCDSPEELVLGQAVNATWGTPTRTTGPGSYSVVATGNVGPPQHLFPSGPGVSTDGKTKTFTGNLAAQDTSQNCWIKDAAASVTVSPATCYASGTASVTGLQNATLVGTLDQTVGTHVATFQSNQGHLFSNGTDTLQVSYTVPAQDTSQNCDKPIHKPKASVNATCVTENYGEGVARLKNKGNVVERFRIVRSGPDVFVKLRPGKAGTVNLFGLKVGSVIKVKARGKVLDRDKVEMRPFCQPAPPPHTGAKESAAPA